MTPPRARSLRRAPPLAAMLALASCVGGPRAPTVSSPPITPPPAAAAPRSALEAGVRAGPPVATLPIDPVRARDALAGFRASCAALLKRADVSGLTRAPDWQPACAAAADWREDAATAFFRRYFETALVGDGHLFATGYYEPQIDAAPAPSPHDSVPIYGPPNDMVTADLGQWAPDLKGRSVKGRVQNGRLVPYYDRGQIEDGAIRGKAPVLGYAADRIAFFFLQVQGSGRLRQPDGRVIQLNYAGQNGLAYTGIGKWMVAQGLITIDQGSMQGIVAWLRAHPDQADMVMRQNRSFVFFKVIPGMTEPLGAMDVPVAGHVSVAADPAFTPLGAPVWLSADRIEAEDTGGAIKGPNRFDTYWGAGNEAATIAGGMSARGLSYLLLPAGTLARLGVDGGRAARS